MQFPCKEKVAGSSPALGTIYAAVRNRICQFEIGETYLSLKGCTFPVASTCLNLFIERRIKMKNPFKKNIDFTAHTHCIICSQPITISDTGYLPKKYICKQCVASFPSEYILHRLECDEKDIVKKEFEILEARLNFGKTKDCIDFGDDWSVMNGEY